MSYKSQLKGWSIDRVIEMYRIPKHITPTEDPSLTTLMADADKLAAYAYVPEEDLVSTTQTLYSLLKDAPPDRAGFDEIRMSLDLIQQERIMNGIDTKPTEQ